MNEFETELARLKEANKWCYVLRNERGDWLATYGRALKEVAELRARELREKYGAVVVVSYEYGWPSHDDAT